MWHSWLIYPYVAKCCKIFVREAVEDGDKVVPRGVAVGVGAQVLLYATTKGLLAHYFVEFLHHYGRFVVDYLSVDKARIAQIIKLLAYRCATRSAVLVECRGGVGLQAVERVVDLGEEGLGHACCEVVGKDLLGPHVVKPAHGDIVAKPHVRRLVGYELYASELLVGRRVIR